jgi:hypothetical protein
MAELEEGGMFDEDTMPDWMRSMRGVAPNRPPQQQTTIMAAPSPFPEPIQQLPPGFTSSSQLFASYTVYISGSESFCWIRKYSSRFRFRFERYLNT